MSEASINQVIKRIGYKSKVSGHGFRHMMQLYCMSMGLIPLDRITIAHVDKNTIRGTYNLAVYRHERATMMQYFSDLLLGNVS
jgi:integrase